ncbi:hypothetical protein ACFT5B_02090 [Luteimicrobium sp. NPDC057192]|uniref:hypothetical protein n=1 Tax=Luteimicrobium sp. NPDC057192 TaxID=3346042 RepID=UPI0036341140
MTLLDVPVGGAADLLDAGAPDEASALDRPALDRPALDRPALDRAALARAALARAEQRTGVRRPAVERDWVRTWTASQPTATPAVAATPAAPDAEAAPVSPEPPPPLHGPDLPVAADVRHLLPGGVLRRGRTVVVTGSRSLLLALLARASADGAWVAVVGLPALGLVAAAEAGVDLDRLALVPDPGLDAPVALAALLDGMDVVVVGPGAALADADRRRLQARARERGTVLVTATAWPGAHVVLDAAPEGWSGARGGAGWLRRQRVVVERTGRAGCTPGRFEVELPLGSRRTASFRDTAVPGAPVLLDTAALDAEATVPASRPGRPDLRLVG